MTVSGPPYPQDLAAPASAGDVTPQPVLNPLTEAAIFLVLTVDAGGEAAVRELLADLAGLQRSVGFRVPGGQLSCVAGIGSAAWDRLFAGPRPAQLHPFRALSGRHQAPATPGDLLFHIRANQVDLCFEFAAQIMSRLTGQVSVADEAQGFRYFDERDLIGFVDGTENPAGRDAIRAAFIGGKDPEFGRGEFGTYFIGYAASPAVTEQMLATMFLGSPPGLTDRILDFSTPVTGCLFFVPSADFLDHLPAPPVLPDQPGPPSAPRDGSLGIGGLLRSDHR